MKISFLTLFPEMFVGPFDHSIVKRAKEKNFIELEFVNIRNFGLGNHKVVDDRPFGGGVGMVMRVDVLDSAIQKTRDNSLAKNEEKVILLDARGKTFTQKTAKEFSETKHLIIICGHYEGVDERVRMLVDETVSIGDFIVTGGEIPAMLIADATVRLLPGVLKENATSMESFSLVNKDSDRFLEYPQYTLPREYKGVEVPEILLSGNHKAIETWRSEKAHEITQTFRPDLLKNSQ